MKNDSSPFPLQLTTIAAVFLTKLGKHLAVVASFLILGQASGRFHIGQLAIFGLIFLSALIHFTGKAIQVRSLARYPSHSN